MKKMILAGVAMLAVVAQATVINLPTYSSGTLNTYIPDGSTVGLIEQTTFGAGTVGNNFISQVDVHLSISGGYNGDLYGYLMLQSADGTTTTAILLNRVGRGETGVSSYGYAASGFDNITLSSAGVTDIHTTPTPTSGGTYAADGRAVNPNGDFSGASATQGLGTLIGHNAQGTWTLFLADMAAGSQSTLVSWGLDVTVVPEPVTWALAGFVGIVGVGACIRRRSDIRSAAEKISRWVDAV